jgi:hypothetical protein
MIDWNNIISNLVDGEIVTVDPVRWDMRNLEYEVMINLWKDKNFNINIVKWTNYYDTIDISLKLSAMLNIIPLRSWISCVDPGYMTGYHYDIDDNESEYLKHGLLKRYSVFINPPSIGQIFILGKNYHVNEPQGTILKWDNYKEWHNGINGSLEKKYMFHIIGY